MCNVHRDDQNIYIYITQQKLKDRITLQHYQNDKRAGRAQRGFRLLDSTAS